MANLTTQKITRAGAEPTFVAASGGGDKFVPDDDVHLEFINGSGSPITATVVTPGNVDGEAVADRTITLPANKRTKAGPFPKQVFANNADGGKAAITYSDVTTLTVGVFQVPR